MKSKKTILVVAAHPDDEVLGCGGTISKLSKLGNKIHILILGEGITSRQKTRDPKLAEKRLKKLHSDVIKASNILGAVSARVLQFPDNRFDAVNRLDIIKSIEDCINEIKPERIYTHHHADLNIDHRITFGAVMTASRPLRGNTVKEIYSFEVPSSTEWQFQSSDYVFKPNMFEILTESDIKRKIKAMESYTEEKRKFPHPRSPRSLQVLANFRGTNIGFEYAEAFEVVRLIK